MDGVGGVFGLRGGFGLVGWFRVFGLVGLFGVLGLVGLFGVFGLFDAGVEAGCDGVGREGPDGCAGEAGFGG